MKLTLTLEADSVNVQALNMGRIVVDDIRSLQYRTYHGKGQRLAVLTVTSDE